MGVPSKALSLAISVLLLLSCSANSNSNDLQTTSVDEDTQIDQIADLEGEDPLFESDPLDVEDDWDSIASEDVEMDEVSITEELSDSADDFQEQVASEVPDEIEETQELSDLDEETDIEVLSDESDYDEYAELEEDVSLTSEIDSKLNQAEDDAEMETVSDEAIAKPLLNNVKLQKTSSNDTGSVTVSLSDEAPFVLRQTTSTEYVLELPSVELSDSIGVPQVAPAGEPGIRSARAVKSETGSQIRMFVDEGVSLLAKPNGEEIVISAVTGGEMIPSLARGQLAEDTKSKSASGKGIVSADGSKIYTGRLISLDLQDTDIDNALRIIAEVSNLNIIASDDVRGKVTLRLVDVPWDQALDVILRTNGLDQVSEGNVIRIAPVDQLRAEREALLEAKRAQENLEDLTVRYIRVSYARTSEMIEPVESVLSERGTVTFDERTNQLIIKDIKKGHEQSLALISKLDLRTPQVLLETQIVEAERRLLRDLGFQWNYQYNAGPEFGNSTGYNFPNAISVDGGLGSADGSSNIVGFPADVTDSAGSAVGFLLDSADGTRLLSARLSALEQEGTVRVVSRPQVATINNKEAEIKAIEVLRVRTNDSGVSIATGSGASSDGGGSTAFEEIEVGIELRVTPQASPDYYVLLDIDARSSTIGTNVVDNIPSTIERTANSSILVKSGQTFALGGVYRIEDQENVDGVPFFKDIPFFGHAFRRSFADKSDEELIFFITPHIIEGSFDPSKM